MQIVIGADSAGSSLSRDLIPYLRARGTMVTDVNADVGPDADFPDVAIEVSQAVVHGEADLGILICGSGVGVSIAANKIVGIRAALAHDLVSAQGAREHEDANVLCLGAKVVAPALARQLVDVFIESAFSPQDPYLRRIDKIAKLEVRRTDAGPA